MVFIFLPSAWAEHKYTIAFILDYTFDKANYYATIYPPQGGWPNSGCMHMWQVPANLVVLTTSNAQISVNIEDKDNIGGCRDDPKYNTWRFTISQYQPAGLPKKDVASGSVQFYHAPHLGKWETTIFARNFDGTPPYAPIADRAECYDKTGAHIVSCLNKPVKGKDSAELIMIYLRYPVYEHYDIP